MDNSNEVRRRDLRSLAEMLAAQAAVTETYPGRWRAEKLQAVGHGDSPEAAVRDLADRIWARYGPPPK